MALSLICTNRFSVQNILDIDSHAPLNSFVRSCPHHRIILSSVHAASDGYDYPCLETPDELRASSYCTLKFDPFRGVNCSDAAGRERTFADIMEVLSKDPTASNASFDESTQTPFFNYDVNGTAHQIWYDDKVSSAAKYGVAADMGVRGTGPFCFGDLSYASKESREQARGMWEALRSYKAKRHDAIRRG